MEREAEEGEEEVAKVTEMLTDERGGGEIISHYKLRGSRMRHQAAAATAPAELMTSCPARPQLPPPQPCSSFRPAIHDISEASRPSASPAVLRESSKRGSGRERGMEKGRRQRGKNQKRGDKRGGLSLSPSFALSLSLSPGAAA